MLLGSGSNADQKSEQESELKAKLAALWQAISDNNPAIDEPKRTKKRYISSMYEIQRSYTVSSAEDKPTCLIGISKPKRNRTPKKG